MHAQAATLGLLPRRVIGIAASAGGVEALRRLVAQLPSDLDAAICVVLHLQPSGRSLLAPILDRDSDLDTVVAEHGAPLRAGRIYVAPADHHLLVRRDAVELSRGPKENGVRPAADPMFRSLAGSWGERAVAVVLSGALDDGAAGAVAVAMAGGNVVVQEPGDALVPGMPSSTIAVTSPDEILPIDAMGEALRRLVESPRPDGFTCPERSVEGELWAALDVLEARGELLRRIADRMDNAPRTEHRFRQDASDTDDRAAVIRRVLGAAG